MYHDSSSGDVGVERSDNISQMDVSGSDINFSDYT
jgi:hypothetical protein